MLTYPLKGSKKRSQTLKHSQTLVLTFEIVNLLLLLNVVKPCFLEEPYAALASLAEDSFQETVLLTEYPPLAGITETFVCSCSRKLLSHSL